MGQMQIFEVQKFSKHQLKARFANLEEDFCLAGLTSGTPPHRAPLSTAWSIAQRKCSGPAGWIVYTQEYLGRFPSKTSQITFDVRYVVLFL